MDQKATRSKVLVEVAPGSGVFRDDKAQRDTLELAKTGKKEVLKRRFGIISMIGFSSSILVTWESVLDNVFTGLTNSGPAGAIYGYLLNWIGLLCVYTAMSELASMLPCAGGQYHWTYIMAPERLKRPVSYVVGWITVLTWISVPILTSTFVATIIQAIIKLHVPSYHETGWQNTLIGWAVLLVCVVFSIWLGPILPMVEVLVLIIHVVGFFALLIPLLALSPRSNAHEVFTEFWNQGGWPTQGLSFFVGLTGTCVAMIGNDGSVHMAEEVSNSSITVPRSIMISIVFNGALGFGVLLAMLLSVGPDLSLLQQYQQKSKFPWMDVLVNGVGSLSGATVIIVMFALLRLCAGVAVLSSGSRMLWSFSREQAVPGWRWLRQINRHTSIPTNSVFAIAAASALLLLINIGSSVALDYVLSLVLQGFCSSYLVTLCLLLYRRLRDDIQDVSTFELDYSVSRQTATGSRFIWGPWHLKSWFGTINNIVAICYLILIMFFGLWPPGISPTAASMNWAPVVFGSVAIVAATYYFVSARRTYTGPTIEIDVMKI